MLIFFVMLETLTCVNQNNGRSFRCRTFSTHSDLNDRKKKKISAIAVSLPSYCVSSVAFSDLQLSTRLSDSSKYCALTFLYPHLKDGPVLHAAALTCKMGLFCTLLPSPVRLACSARCYRWCRVSQSLGIDAEAPLNIALPGGK